MKKILKTALVAFALPLAAMPLCACQNVELIERNNSMTITAVTQHADGSVYATLDFGDTKFSANDYYNIQFSIDGGRTWAKSGAVQLIDNTVNSVPVVMYNAESERYILGSNAYEETSAIDLKGGDEINVTMRFMGDDKYKTSEQCNTVKYTVKAFGKAGAHIPKVEGYSASYGQVSFGGKEKDYVFEKQPDNSFKLKRLIYNPDAADENEIIHAELLADDLGAFEYKFYTLSEEDKNEYDYSVWHGSEENVAETSGWTDYNAEIGITVSMCNAHAVTVYFTDRPTDGDGNVLEEVRRKCRIAALLLRYKGNETTLRSLVVPVHLLLTEWENA